MFVCTVNVVVFVMLYIFNVDFLAVLHGAGVIPLGFKEKGMLCRNNSQFSFKRERVLYGVDLSEKVGNIIVTFISFFDVLGI